MTSACTQLDLFSTDEIPTSAVTPAERFWQFHQQNPRVYVELKQLALELVEHGRTHIGIAMIYEVLRWQVALRTKGDPYRLNNDYRAYYARLLMERNPEWEGLFELREVHDG